MSRSLPLRSLLALVPMLFVITACDDDAPTGVNGPAPLPRCVDYDAYVHVAGSLQITGLTNAVAVDTDHAYLAYSFHPGLAVPSTAGSSRGAQGLIIVDITDPTEPTVQTWVSIQGAVAVLGVALMGDHAVVAVQTSEESGALVVVAISPVSTAAVVATLDLEGSPAAVAATGAYAYVANTTEGVQVIDLSDPLDPQLTTTLSADGPVRIETDGNDIYVAESDRLTIHRLDDPAFPEFRASAGGLGTPVDLAVVDTRVFLAVEERRLVIIDASSSGPPMPVGTVDLDFAPVGVGASGDQVHVVTEDAVTMIDADPPGEARIIGSYTLGYEPEDVVVTGERAYAISKATFHVVDTAGDLVPPVVSTSSLDGTARKVAVDGELVFVPTRYALHILDLEIPHAPRLLAQMPHQNQVPLSIVEDGGWVYFMGDDGELHIVDVGDPQSPRIASVVQLNGRVGVAAVAADGNWVYAGSRDQIMKVDVSDPENPVILESIALRAYSMLVSSGYLYVAAGAGLYVVDLQDFAAGPIGEDPGGGGTTSDMCLVENTLYMSHNGRGLSIWDVQDPTAPTRLSVIEDLRFAMGVEVVDDILYVSDEYAGMKTFDVSDPLAPEPMITPAGTGHALAVRAVNGHLAVVDVRALGAQAQLDQLQVLPVSCR